MKKLNLLFICLISCVVKAQVSDTLFANDRNNVAVFFPDRIRQAVVGVEDFVFSYNQEHPQYFGLLQARPGNSSNLLVITEDGKIYSFILAYKEDLETLVYFPTKDLSIGNEKPSITKDSGYVDSLRVPRENLFLLDRKVFLEKRAQFYESISNVKLKKKKRNGLVLQVNQIYHEREEAYMVFEIKNESLINFEPEYLRLYISKGNNKRNSSFQKIHLKPILKYDYPRIVKPGDQTKFVFVLPKFSLGRNQKIEIELRERRGSRVINMVLPSTKLR